MYEKKELIILILIPNLFAANEKYNFELQKEQRKVKII
tara:strand:+ start:743 stop:856 length:114 start_codon:yes stop_codon:yes gene_type:complete